MGKLWRIDGRSPNSPMFSPANILRYTVRTMKKLNDKCDRAWENRSYLHINWIPLFVSTWKLHSCTTQKHQELDDRWPSLLSQTAFYRCCKTTRMHFSALRDINRTSWGTSCRLLLTAVLAHPCELYQFWYNTEGTALMFESKWLL